MEFVNLKMEDYPSFLKLYNSVIPAEEKRIYENEKHLDNFIKMKGGKFNAFSAKDGGLYLGFLSYWTFEGYTYIEHFAVDPECRGKNLSRLMLNHLFKEISPNVLAQVPVGSQERINLLEKNGFEARMNLNYNKKLPGKGQEVVEMVLLTHGDVNLHNIDSIKDMLQEVFNLNEGE